MRHGLAMIADWMEESYLNESYRKILAHLEINHDISIDLSRNDIRGCIGSGFVDNHLYSNTINPRLYRGLNIESNQSLLKFKKSVASKLSADELAKLDSIVSRNEEVIGMY